VDDSALWCQAVLSGRSPGMNRVTDFYSQQQQTATSDNAPTTVQRLEAGRGRRRARIPARPNGVFTALKRPISS